MTDLVPPLNDTQYCDFWTSMIDLHFQVDVVPKPGRPSRQQQVAKLDEELAQLEKAVVIAKEQHHIPSRESDRWASLVGVRFGADLALRPGESLDIYERRIANELVCLENAVALAKKRRNMLSTASRLPTDVWSNIFLAVRDIWPPSWRHLLREPSVFDPGYAKLLFICSTWYDIAISTPALWTRVHYQIADSSNVVPTFIQRSGTLPLDLHFMGYNAFPNISAWIQPSTLHRISSLSLEESERDQLDELARHLVPKMDCLKELNISLETSEDPLLPPEFLCETRLLRLGLNNCALAWDHSLFNSSLTQLKLSGYGPDDLPPAAFPSFEQLANVLARTTSLQRLELVDVFPIGSDVRPSIVSLPSSCRMAKFEAKYCQMECLRLLSHLTVPLECTIDAVVLAREDSNSEEEYSFAAPGTASFNTDWDPEDFDSGDSDYDSDEDLADWRYDLEDHRRQYGLFDEDDPDATEEELESRWLDDWYKQRREHRRSKWQRKQGAIMARWRKWNTQQAMEVAVKHLYRSGREQRDICSPQELVVSPDGLHFHQHELPRSEWTTFAGYTGFPREEPHSPEHDGSTYFGVSSHYQDYRKPKEALSLSRYMLFTLPAMHDVRALSISRDAATDMKHLWDGDFVKSLSAVRRLGIDAGGGVELLKALATVDERMREMKLLPLLEVIHIHVESRDQQQPNFPEREMKALVNIIKERRRMKRPLRELVVDQSMAWQSMWENVLKPLVLVTFCDFRRVAINRHR
ncbi:unnamed protein product [Peniophora sp. CBMAI 1063]|nr:unnamed protein product [Peniophora sp. CBMAI 1063]